MSILIGCLEAWMVGGLAYKTRGTEGRFGTGRRGSLAREILVLMCF